MRELRVRIKFTRHSLGNVRQRWFDEQAQKRRTYFAMPRTPDGRITFVPTWWKSHLSFAAELLCRHQGEVGKLHFDMLIEGTPRPAPQNLYRRFYAPKLFALHEAFWPGQTIELSVVVPDTIGDDDFRQLMETTGRFRGISPARPKEFGFFTVESVARGKVREDSPTVNPSENESNVTTVKH